MKLPSWLEWLDGMAGMNRVWLVLLAGWERNRELVKRNKPREAGLGEATRAGWEMKETTRARPRKKPNGLGQEGNTAGEITYVIVACLILNHCPHQAYCCLRPSTPPFRPERDCRLPSPNGYGFKVTLPDVDGSIRRFGNKPRVSPTSFERTHLDDFFKGYQRVMQGIGSKPRALAKGTEAEAVPNA